MSAPSGDRTICLAIVSMFFWLIGSIAGCAAPSAAGVLVNPEFIRDYAETAGYTNGRPTSVRVTPDGSAVLFLRSGPRDTIRSLFEMTAATGDVRSLLSAEDLLHGGKEVITPEEKARRERMREGGTGLAWYQLSHDGQYVLTGLSGRLYVVRRSDGHVTSLPESDAGPAMDARFSPDGTHVACVRGHDLYVIDWEAGTERAVTSGGTADVTHGEAEFVAAEEMDRHTGYWWSGDGAHIAFEEADLHDVEQMTIADPYQPTSEPQRWRYPRPGKANAKVRLGIVSVAGGDVRWVDWDRETYPYMACVRWGERSPGDPLTILVQNREQTEQVLYRVEPAGGELTELLREADPAWVEIHADMPRWLQGASEFLWQTDRTGHDVLEVRDADGSLRRTIDASPVRIDGIASVQADGKRLMIRGGEDPTQTLLYSLSLETGEAALAQEQPADWSVTASDNWETMVLTKSTLDGHVETTVVSKRNNAAPAFHGLPSAAERPPFEPSAELFRVDTGPRAFHGLILRPRDFQQGKRYPVLLRVYAGPGHNMVTCDALGQRLHRDQWLADQGFIIVSFDGRGTPRRGREWDRAAKGNLIDTAMEDQIAGLRAAAARFAEMDMDRVGVYGWSFGGYFSAMAALKRPDVFRAAIAGAPVVDWQDYDTHYTERFLGLPAQAPQAYRVSNVLTYADRLDCRLLIIHGTADDNVYFLHSLKLCDALMRAGGEFNLLPLPGITHSPREPVVAARIWQRTVEFFRSNLR